jgi:dTMP kinase
VSIDLFRRSANHPGFLVTIDGPNGSGKTFLTEAMAKALRQTGAAVHSTRQPSPTPMGNFVRDAEVEIRGRALACLVAADRHHQSETEICSQLKAGKIVLCDRYVESSLVLQRLDDVEPEFIVAVNSGIPRPDLRIRLFAATDVLRERLAARAPDPGRRLEQIAGPERELDLYADADQLLIDRYGLGATLYDTTRTEADELGASAAQLVLESREAYGATPPNTDAERL